MLFTRDTLEYKDKERIIRIKKNIYYAYTNQKIAITCLLILGKEDLRQGVLLEKKTFQNDKRTNSTERYKNPKSVCIQ